LDLERNPKGARDTNSLPIIAIVLPLIVLVVAVLYMIYHYRKRMKCVFDYSK
jgi:hypothetical protein